MSSAGAASMARAMREVLQQKYKASIDAFAIYLQTERNIEVINKYNLLRYNWAYIPSRFMLIESKDRYFIIPYTGLFDPAKDNSKIVELNPQDLQLVRVRKASIMDKINVWEIKEYLILESLLLPKIFNSKYKFVVENLEGFHFYDEAKQQLLKDNLEQNRVKL